MAPDAGSHDFDDERLDCGHYEYLSRAVPTSGGFMICPSCHAAMVNSVTRPRTSPARRGLAALARNVGRSLAYMSAV